MNVIRSVLGRLAGQRLSKSFPVQVKTPGRSWAPATGLSRPFTSDHSWLYTSSSPVVRAFSSLGHIQQRPPLDLPCTHTSPPFVRSFASLGHIQTPLLQPPPSLPHANLGGVRTVIRYSMQSGRRKTVRAVIYRFYRLHWGIWIRTKAGRNRRFWRKTESMRKRSRQHVFCSAVQSHMLDKMTSKFWHKKTFYVDDPYESYHKRDNYPCTRRL